MPFVINGSTGINLGTQPLQGVLPDANAPSGSVIQVVHLQTYGYTTNATSTFNDVPNLSLSITPSSTTSKILVQLNLAGCGKFSGNTWGKFRLLRDGSPIVTFCDSAGWTNTTVEVNHSVGYDYLDSPSTISPVTYKVQFAAGNGVSSAQVGNYVSALTDSRHSIVLMEIAA